MCRAYSSEKIQGNLPQVPSKLASQIQKALPFRGVSTVKPEAKAVKSKPTAVKFKPFRLTPRNNSPRPDMLFPESFRAKPTDRDNLILVPSFRKPAASLATTSPQDAPLPLPSSSTTNGFITPHPLSSCRLETPRTPMPSSFHGMHMEESSFVDNLPPLTFLPML